MQTTLLGLAIAFIVALLAALIGPYFIDWNQFRPQFEAEATRIIGVPVRVGGELDARLLPAPTLRLRSVTFGGNNDLGRLRADKLDVEFSLSSLMRGEWRATELTVGGMAADLGLDAHGRVDLPSTASGTFNLASLAIERLNLTGRIALHDAASRHTLELNDIAFSGDVRSLAGSVRGDGNFAVSGIRYPFRVSSSPSADGGATRVHLNIDPGERPISADLEGVLAFENRTPRFEGAITLGVPPSKDEGGDTGPTPWKIAAKVKADPAGAKFDQVEASFGKEDTAPKLSGAGDVRFGASPLLRAALSARQIDADKLIKQGGNADPLRVVPTLRAALAAIPQTPIPAQIDFTCEQIMLGGRPLQNIAADLHTDGKSWTFRRLDLRAPGATEVALSGATPGSDSFSGRLSVESSDPDMLIAWLQGRSEVVRRSTRPLRVAGDLTIASNHLSIEGLKAEIEGGSVEGRIAFAQTTADKGSRIEAELKADRLDLDAAASFARSLAGPQPEWPDQAKLALDVGRAISAGQELRPFLARLSYDEKNFTLDQLKFGQAGGVMLDGGGNLDRSNLEGRLVVDATAGSLDKMAAFIAPLAPSVSERLQAIDSGSGPASASLVLDLGAKKGATGERTARAQLDFAMPQLRGQVTASAAPSQSSLGGIDLDALSRTDFAVQTNLSSEQGASLLKLLGLDGVIAAGEGATKLDASVNGAWRKPLQLTAHLSGGLNADVRGGVELSGGPPKGSVDLHVRNANLAPLFGIHSSEKAVQNINLSSRVTLNGNQLMFQDLNGSASGSHLRGHLAVTLEQEKAIEGEIGLDAIDVGPVVGLLVGATGHGTDEPLTAGLLSGWRGQIAFQALRGDLPGGVEVRPISGTIRSSGQSLTLDSLKGGIGGGKMAATIDAKNGANGLAMNAQVQLSDVDGAALHFGGLTMPKGRLSLQTALSSQGRSVAALTGALSGNGTMTLNAAEIAGLGPRAFEIAIRANDRGQVPDDERLRQVVEPALDAGKLSIDSAQIPFTVRDGRLRVSATTLEGKNARAIVSGGYDIPADQIDIRVSLTPIMTGLSGSPPEIQLFVAGSPDKLSRSLDLTSLSSWLAVRTIDRETRRLDAIERGEPPPATAALPTLVSPDTGSPEQPQADVPLPGRDPRRAHPKPKATPAPRPPAAALPNSPVASQVAPLPPPIEIRPAPGPAPARPKPRAPLVLTPPANR